MFPHIIYHAPYIPLQAPILPIFAIFPWYMTNYPQKSKNPNMSQIQPFTKKLWFFIKKCWQAYPHMLLYSQFKREAPRTNRRSKSVFWHKNKKHETKQLKSDKMSASRDWDDNYKEWPADIVHIKRVPHAPHFPVSISSVLAYLAYVWTLILTTHTLYSVRVRSFYSLYKSEEREVIPWKFY